MPRRAGRKIWLIMRLVYLSFVVFAALLLWWFVPPEVWNAIWQTYIAPAYE